MPSDRVSPPATADVDPVGRVLGSMDSTPLDLWVGVEDGAHVQLDDLAVVETAGPDGPVRFYGIVDIVRKKYEGATFDGDAFRAAEGTLPVDVSYAAHVQITRIDPEVFVPPHPGDRVSVVRGEALARALSFDRMAKKVAIGLSRSGEPLYANVEFLDGTRGAHVSISGVSGVATKTSYATFLLYSLFHSDALGIDATNAKAIVFNVKGEDLLWLDKPNARLDEAAHADYRRLGLPVGPFTSVGLFAPARRTPQPCAPMPDTGGRLEGVSPYLWTLREFARDGLLRFAFADGEDVRAQISFLVTRVERMLEVAAQTGDADDPGLMIDGTRVESFSDLVALLDGNTLQQWAPSTAVGTLDAFRRRLHAAAAHIGHLVRGDADARGFGVRWDSNQVTVVDIHRLHSLAQMFVVGVFLKRILAQKESQGTSRPLVFVVLDELNKYAPREGWSPIREVLLDVAERGRSLGVALIGAQQTASEVARRVVSNAALRVVGRLDAAESERSEYGFLGKVSRLRAPLLQPGTMIVAQPEIPTALLLRFPFPAWATRQSEAATTGEADPFARVRKP